MNNRRSFGVKDMVMVGSLAGMCVVATTLKIPFGFGMVHMGSAFLFTTGIVFGGIYAGLAGAIGSALFDLMMGFSPYTLWSFFIKGIAGLIVGVVAKGLWPESKPSFSMLGTNWFVRAVLGCILGAAWTLGGYILAWWQVLGSFIVALNNTPSSLITSGIGSIVALLLSPKLRRIFNK